MGRSERHRKREAIGDWLVISKPVLGGDKLISRGQLWFAMDFRRSEIADVNGVAVRVP
jgi:hypothetical protein